MADRQCRDDHSRSDHLGLRRGGPRDPAGRCQWIALVDGKAHQIEYIQAEKTGRNIDIVIIVDFVHVLEYLWKAAWSFFPEGDAEPET